MISVILNPLLQYLELRYQATMIRITCLMLIIITVSAVLTVRTECTIQAKDVDFDLALTPLTQNQQMSMWMFDC